MSTTKTPKEILEFSYDVSNTKAHLSVSKLIILGILAGAFIAFAAEASNMAAFNLLADPTKFGLGRLVAGAMFSVGLMLVVLTGGELFTGNSLMITGVITKRISVKLLLRNWIIVYIANLVGSVLIAYLMHKSGLFGSGDGLLGAITIKIAVSKTNLPFISAFVLGIMCNWLVCLAVWMSWASSSVPGKLMAIFFPICLFVTSGFEHSIANMYYIPAGMFAKTVPALMEKAMTIGVTEAAAENLNMSGFFATNLLPVTIGNVFGGVVFVALAYLVSFREKKEK